MSFEQCFAVVIDTEGGFSVDPHDPGNWTGAIAGTGALHGTKYGISARAYPAVDIAALTLDQAREIYRRDYWQAIAGDRLPPPLALLVFDAAVNSGVRRAVTWLQAAIGVRADGDIGPATLAALEAHSGRGAALCAEYLARRMVFDANLPTWPGYALGWARRLAALPWQSLTIGG